MKMKRDCLLTLYGYKKKKKTVNDDLPLLIDMSSPKLHSAPLQEHFHAKCLKSSVSSLAFNFVTSCVTLRYQVKHLHNVRLNLGYKLS